FDLGTPRMMHASPAHGSVIQVAALLIGLALLAPRTLTYIRARTSHRQSLLSFSWFPVALVLALSCLAAGRLVLAVHLAPWAGAARLTAQALALAGYPLLLVAVAAFPRPARRPDVPSFRLVLDGAIILAAATTFSWYFVLGPAFDAHVPARGDVLGVMLPIMDLLLVVALLILSARTPTTPRKREWTAMVSGIALLLFSDSCLEYPPLASNAITATVAHAGGVAAALMLLVSLYLATGESRDRSNRSRDAEASAATPLKNRRLWDGLLPYALIPAAGFLAFNGWQGGAGPETLGGTLAGGLVLMSLALVRQVVSIRENVRLYGDLDNAYRQSVESADSMRILNAELEQARDALSSRAESLAGDNLRLRTQASTDPLTGLSNHRSVVTALDRELERSARYSRACSVLFLDIDHFKAINDNCGHLAGDTVLREIVVPISSALRSVDVLGRWGGEEFVIVMPETEIGDAMTAADRIREAVGSYHFGVGAGGRLTCSIGVATFPYDAASRDEVIEAADRAMYAAKRLGRDQVRAAVDPSAIGFISGRRREAGREEASLWGVVEAFTTIIKVHDPAADEHLHQVSTLAMKLALTLGLGAAETRSVGLAARLHDIGKIAVPQTLLNKTEELTPEEWAHIRSHPEVGADLVSRIPSMVMLAPLIRSHHERWDGEGYPDGLAGEGIPAGARIIAIVDAYDSMLLGRFNRHPVPTSRALEELRDAAGSQFDPTMVAAFADMIEGERVLEKQAV
ncbi:MAG TPA: diguanylate cyclase, partial [Chloroflexota bacterium]|nr:diguanylate cyclase [Chloroflexota bacterium]